MCSWPCWTLCSETSLADAWSKPTRARCKCSNRGTGQRQNAQIHCVSDPPLQRNLRQKAARVAGELRKVLRRDDHPQSLRRLRTKGRQALGRLLAARLHLDGIQPVAVVVHKIHLIVALAPIKHLPRLLLQQLGPNASSQARPRCSAFCATFTPAAML